MRLTSFVVFKSWASNRLRTALTVLGIALGIAIVVAIHVVDHNTIQSRLRQTRADFGRVDLEVIPMDQGRDPAKVRSELSARSDVRDVGLFRSAEVSATTSKALGTVRLYGLSPLPGTAFSHYVVAEGEDLDDLMGDQAVLVGRAYAEAYGLKIGDALTLSTPTAAIRARCKDGQLIDAEAAAADAKPVTVRVRGILAPEHVGRRHLGEVVIGSYGLARTLAPTTPTYFQLNRVPGTNVDRLRQELQGDFQVLDDRSALLGEAADERAFRNGVKVLGCLALVLGMFVVFQTLSQSLVERLKQLGLLRCLGASRRAVASIFLLDASMMAAVGSVLGILIGLLLASLLQSMQISTLGMGRVLETFEVPLGPVLWTAALGVVFTLAGAAFPLWKARNLSPMAVLDTRGLDGSGNTVMRGVNLFLFLLLVLLLPGAYLAMTPLLSEGGRETFVVLGQLGSMILLFGGVLLVAPSIVRVLAKVLLLPLRPVLGLPVFLVEKALHQNPGRFAAGVCGLSVVLIALLALKHVTGSLRGEVVAFGAVTMADRVFLAGAGAQKDSLDVLHTIPGVQSFQAFEGSVHPSFQLRGLGVDALTARDGQLAQDPTTARRYVAERGLIVSKRLALLRDLQVDHFLPVLTDDGPKAYRILKISDQDGFFPDERAYAIADPKWLRNDFCVPAGVVTQIAIRIDAGSAHHQVMEDVQQALPWINWKKTGPDIIAYHLRDVGRDFFLFDLLLFLILILAGVGLVNAMTIAALGRSREIGVLRALGMGRRALRQTFLLEGGVVAILASMLSLGLCLPLGAIVVRGLRMVSGLEVPLVVPWNIVAITPVIAIAVGLLAAILPGLRVVREPTAEAIRYE